MVAPFAPTDTYAVFPVGFVTVLVSPAEDVAGTAGWMIIRVS
jgi:hypothetical protein